MFARGIQRRFVRLLTLLFAAQVVAGGFCLMSAQAHELNLAMHAMDHSASSMPEMHAGCTANASQSDSSQHTAHDDGCSHCNQPTAMTGNLHTFQFADIGVLAQPITLIDVTTLHPVHTGFYAQRTPTGPPRSSSLLFTITQRIRV